MTRSRTRTWTKPMALLVLAHVALACDRSPAPAHRAATLAAPHRGAFDRHVVWVGRVLRSHGEPGARAEVLFSPLRLEYGVLDAEVDLEDGDGAVRYRLREGGSEPPRPGAFTRVGTGPSRIGVAADTCSERDPGRSSQRAPCVWLAREQPPEGAEPGWTLWVAYRRP